MNVETYIQTYEQIKASVKNDEVAAVILNQIGKDARTAVMAGSGAVEDRPRRVVRGDEPATDKQKGYLEKLGVGFENGVTRKEASELIEQAKSR